MSTQQEVGVKDLITHIIDDMANAISERQGEGKQEQVLRARIATSMIEELRPQDVTQVMLAGYCVMFHAVMTDSIRDTLRGEVDSMRHATRSNIVAMNKSFHMNFDLLQRHQAGAVAGQTEAMAAAMSHPAVAIQPDAAILQPAAAVPQSATAIPQPAITIPQPSIPIQTGLVTSPDAKVVASPVPTPAVPQSRIPIGVAQPRHPQAQNASQPTQQARKPATGEAATPPTSASVSSRA